MVWVRRQRRSVAGSEMGLWEFCSQNCHSDEESYRHVRIFYVFAKSDLEILWLRHRFQKCRKSIFNGFLEAAVFEHCEDWIGDSIQSRSSQAEVDFRDFRGSGELGDGPEKDFKWFWRIFEDFESNPSQPTVQNLDFYWNSLNPLFFQWILNESLPDLSQKLFFQLFESYGTGVEKTTFCQRVKLPWAIDLIFDVYPVTSYSNFPSITLISRPETKAKANLEKSRRRSWG